MQRERSSEGAASAAIAKSAEASKFIPHEIVACILLRLPAKSIGRLRCVCKQWRSLTRDARFIDEHRGLGCASGTHMIMATRFCAPGPSLYEVGPNCVGVKHSLLHLGLKTACYVSSNSLHGLIVVRGILTSEHHLMNPITREIAPLPRKARCLAEHRWQCTGLGFDASRGSYRLVTFKNKATADGWLAACMVLTVGTGEWRHVTDLPCALIVGSPPVFLDGAIHWLAWGIDGHHLRPAMVILAFEVKDETFRFIPAPAETSASHGILPVSLRALRGRVCIVHVSKLAGHLSTRIWKLRCSANREWGLECEINMALWLDQTGCNTPEIIDIRGERVLMQSHDAIYSYHLPTKELHRLHYSTEPLYELGVITESLVPPASLLIL